jgi:hypothetical protein
VFDGLAQASGAAHLTGLVAEVRAVAARARTTPAPLLLRSEYSRYAQTGDRLRYERRYFARRCRLVSLAATALLDNPADSHLSTLVAELEATCDEYTWALPAHEDYATALGRGMDQCVDLFAAETAHTLAETVTLLGDRLPTALCHRVREQVEHRVLSAYFDDPRPQRWESWANNWSAVCAGAAGMAALALVDDPARLDRMVDRVRSAMATFRSGFGADGGCAEGVEYWVYGFGYFTYFAEALRDRTGEDLLTADGIRDIAAFPARVALGSGAYVAFSDSTERPMLPAGLLSRLAARLGTPVPELPAVASLHADHCYRWGHLSRTLAWTDPAILARKAPSGTEYLANLGWVIDRTEAVTFAAKGGHNDEPHNHNDLGHFVLYAGGESLLTDLGAGEYTKDYFGPARYSALHPSAEGHSVPLLDGRAQRTGRDAAATVLEFREHPDGLEFALDLTAAYQVPGLRSLRRTFHWHRRDSDPAGNSPDRLAIVDSLVADRALDLDELFISRRRPVLVAGTATWPGTFHTVALPTSGWQPVVEELATADHHGHPEMVYRLRLRRRAPAGVSSHPLTFTISP